MKNSCSALITFLFTTLALVQLTGCGLKYTPPPSPEVIEEERRFAMQEQLYNDFNRIGKKYSALTYGQLVVVKPDSYKRLDSLYAIKYRHRNEHRPELDRQIDSQKALIANDTIPVLYVETHWFELAQDSTLEYITAEISMKKNNKITDVKNLDYFQVSKAYEPYARMFMKEESFLSPGTYAPSDNELSFYAAYKAQSATLQGEAKDAFMKHTFGIMQIAGKSGTVSTDALLRVLALAEIRMAYPTADVSLLTVKTEEISDTASGKPLFQYYLVTVTDNSTQKRPPVTYKYNAYLQLIP